VQNFVEKTVKKRPIGRRRRRWEDNIKVDLRRKVWEKIEQIQINLIRTQ